MRTNGKSLFNQHQENNESADKLFFYKDEIAIMQKRLEEVVKINSGKEVMALVEHFQNQLIVQRDTIDSIKHAIGLNENAISENILGNPVATDHRKVVDHVEEKDQVEWFEKGFIELRNELKEFLAKWL